MDYDCEDMCRRGFKVYGRNVQLTIAMEELAELTVAISHFMRGRKGGEREMAEELVDVELVCLAIRTLITDEGVSDVDKIKEEKWERFAHRLLNEEAYQRESRREDRDGK